MMDVNFYAPFILSQEALPHLEKTKGNIVFISSVAGVCERENIILFFLYGKFNNIISKAPATRSTRSAPATPPARRR